jgi:TonB family protein
MRGSFAWIVFLCWLAPLAARAQDRDGDRLLDDLDLCPDAAEGPATLFPGDGCPDVDTDGDRIVDDHDVCPAEPETVNGFEDADGCADTEGASVQVLADRIHFATGSHELDGAARIEVRRVAAWLEAHPEALHVQIIGRADARGSAARNDLLSLHRAQSVESALVERGIAATRLTARGFGALPGDTVEARAENRRVELHVALAGREPDGAALARFRGDYDGAPVMLRVGASTREVTVTLHPIEQGVHLMAYASRVVGDRLVLLLAGADREMTITLRLVERGAIGVIETRRGATVERATWSARHEPPFDQSVVVQRITRDRSMIQACYQRELEQEPTLTGRLVVTMTVLESGEVEGVRIVEDTLTPPRAALGACVVRVVDAFEFHPGPSGGSVSYTFPFVFEPQVE